MPSFEATWESADVIDEQFPEFHLENKVKVLVGGIATFQGNKKKPYATLTYTRRRVKP